MSLAALDIGLVRADNPGPFTLQGTNTWLVGRDRCFVVDPGPLQEAHLERVLADAAARGGIAGIAITHDHPDHTEAVAALRERAGGVPVAAARFPADVALHDGDEFGPFTAIATPGHAPDHLALLSGRALFSGDAVLGEGSVFVWPEPGALRGYLAALARLRELELDVICPGHGPPVMEPRAKIEEYLAHRLERERLLLEALDGGARTVEELLDHAWSDAPAVLRPAAAVTLAAHLDKLEEEGRLPGGVERPAVAGLQEPE
ncbi:MAG TPA: MBL fold metallo-hydrolase [Solirubrobacteraceae bacterium]|nr:MBL fold metallo-hydrolase [Solirubrobacteraceae bacterium]